MQVGPHPGNFFADLAGDFAAAMPGMSVRAGARLAVAVSGGADSLALAILLADWARANDAEVHALTVDHGLREAAAGEARQVEAWMSARGIFHTTLRWQEGPHYRSRPASAQAAARTARYGLMASYCASRGCSHLFLAHHADDQAETVLLRLARGSGVDGLAAMTPLARRDGLYLARPLLEIPKARLAAWLERIGQPWIEDPSNSDQAYGRVRLRAARAVLERAGLSPVRLLSTAGHMRRARAALDGFTQDLLDRACAWDRFGIGRLALDPLLAAPQEIGLRALARVLMTGGGQVYRPRFERLLRLYGALRSGPWRDATLHGCALVREGPILVVVREAAQIGEHEDLLRDGRALWDRRFDVEAKGREFRLRRCRQADLPAQVRAMPAWREIPACARETLPALFDSAGLAAVPSLPYLRPDLEASPGVIITAAFRCPRIDQFVEDDAEL